MKTIPVLVLLGFCCATAGIASARSHVSIGFRIGVPAPVIVRRAPPARVVERVVVAPGPGYVWVPGHYTYSGNQWVWLGGAWVVPPAPDARWVDGHWNPASQRWVEAHWVLPPPPPAPPPPEAQAPVVIVATPPPPVREAVSPFAPGPGYVWIAGYWGWEHGRRLWVRGRWERPPHGYHVWVPPHWERHRRGYAFYRGYWR